MYTIFLHKWPIFNWHLRNFEAKPRFLPMILGKSYTLRYFRPVPPPKNTHSSSHPGRYFFKPEFSGFRMRQCPVRFKDLSPRFFVVKECTPCSAVDNSGLLTLFSTIFFDFFSYETILLKNGHLQSTLNVASSIQLGLHYVFEPSSWNIVIYFLFSKFKICSAW